MNLREKKTIEKNQYSGPWAGIANSGGNTHMIVCDYEARQQELESYKAERKARTDATNNGQKKANRGGMGGRRKRKNARVIVEKEVKEISRVERVVAEEWRLVYQFEELTNTSRKRLQMVFLK